MSRIAQVVSIVAAVAGLALLAWYWQQNAPKTLGSNIASDVRLTAEYREWESGSWSPVRANWTYAIVNADNYRSQESLTGVVDPGLAQTTVWVRRGDLRLESATDPTNAVVEQRRVDWIVPLPDDIELSAAKSVGVASTPTVLNALVSLGVAVVDRDAVQQLVSQGTVTIDGSDTILNEPVDIIRIPGNAPGRGGHPALVWITADGIKMRTQHWFGSDPNLQVEVTSLDRNSGVSWSELQLPIDENKPLREAGSRVFDLNSIQIDYAGTGAVFAGDLAKVVNPASLVGLPGYSLGPASFITATLPVESMHSPDARREGWLVAHQISGPDDKYVLVLQALAGRRLPLELGGYSPDDFSREADHLFGAGGYYTTKEDIMLDDFYIADLYTAATKPEITQPVSAVPYEYMLTTTADTVIRSLFLGRGTSREELIAVAEAFLPNHAQ